LRKLRVVTAAAKHSFTKEKWLLFKKKNSLSTLHLTSLTHKSHFKENSSDSSSYSDSDEKNDKGDKKDGDGSSATIKVANNPLASALLSRFGGGSALTAKV